MNMYPGFGHPWFEMNIKAVRCQVGYELLICSEDPLLSESNKYTSHQFSSCPCFLSPNDEQALPLDPSKK